MIKKVNAFCKKQKQAAWRAEGNSRVGNKSLWTLKKKTYLDNKWFLYWLIKYSDSDIAVL